MLKINIQRKAPGGLMAISNNTAPRTFSAN